MAQIGSHRATRGDVDLHRVSAYWLHHTFANHGPDAGDSVPDMQSLLGHAILATAD
ncbi:hypothetical protein [Burkholderia glumae]|uniref:hypothetical protein n=1 Tax=Burkholderia glumae TaxID=337 RepID=UPI0020CE3A6B|nr:hypothetical protein [Burkholderia glumae]